LALGCTVAELQARMSSREFSEWTLFYQQEPWGDERADYRAATIVAAIANTTRGKGQRVYQPADFMPHFGPRETEEQDWQQQLGLVRMLNTALGGDDRRPTKGETR
jgi:hypothetical protein